MKSAEKCIRVTDNVIITDLTVPDKEKNFYFLIADIPDEKNALQLKFHYDPEFDDEDPKEHAKRHVATIIEIPGKENVLRNIRLVNYTAQEAENRGLLHPPG
ncbi:MAG: hypothetical protein NTY06_00200, partial [Candidatus Gottesmanbacteria bacterium]|nr:hypothetical protein [Candidatus Gottesmanbacteria bacterium]